MSIRAVLFDLDDTLYLERTYVESGFATVAAYLEQRFGFGRKALQAELIETLDQDGRGTIFDRVLTNHGWHSSELVQELVSVYRNHTPRIVLDSGIVAILEQLRRSRVKLGILTDGLLVMQKNKILALGLVGLVDAIVCTDELGRDCWKPHPVGFHRLLGLVGVRPEEALFVGNDLVKDVAGARAVGLSAVHFSLIENQVDTATSTIRYLAGLLPLVVG